jgi:uncharacterized protein YecT (DUF1311 family)
MRTQKIIVTLAAVFLLHLAAHAQSTLTVEAMENHYQSCLDQGKDMFGCSKQYYHAMDSMLNVVYNKLRSALDSAHKAKLKKQQVQWLSKPDSYFDKTKNVFKTNNPGIDPYGEAFGGQDDAMIMFDQNAAFVQQRVLELISQLQKAMK